MLDPDVELVYDFFRHIFPDFNINHVTVYKLLWRVEPMPVETIIQETGMSKATIYNILRELCVAGLIRKTSFKPIGYFATSPVKDYSKHVKKIVSKLETSRDRMAELVRNSSGLSGELYLIKRDGGQQRLMVKQGRQTNMNEDQLKEFIKVAEQQLREKETENQKYVLYR